MAKNKVKVEYDVDMEKERRKKQQKNGKPGFAIRRSNILLYGLLLVVEVLFYYFLTPAINVHTSGFWTWVILTLAAIGFCSFDFKGTRITKKGNIKEAVGSTKVVMVSFTTILVLIVGLIIGGLASSKLLRASKYAGIIGDRAIGSLSDVVSQYQVSETYSTIDYNGVPMKVAPLEYAGFIKYLNNKDAGIPGYVLVDPVKNEADYVKIEKPIQYSSSAYFGKNLQRHVQLSYPTYDFNGYYFELDNEGNPYYICPVLKPNAGLFGAKDVKGIVLCDPCSGDCEYMDLGDIPNWVDRVYDGDLLCDRYNWYGMLSGGFINSKIGNKGCKVTTDDYGYKVMDGDVWVYTGVTSVNGDQSNIGFVLMNSRTAESKYFAIAGAEEHSAMSSAEGQVQNLGYTSSFPSLINIGNVPTYIMVLKDNAGLVKMYALVNVEKYSIVATGATQKEALASYRKLLAENSIATSGNDVSEDTLSKKITVTQIRYITVENETYVYITAKDRSVYKQNFAENESLIKIEEGDVITVHYMESDDGVNTLLSYE